MRPQSKKYQKKNRERLCEIKYSKNKKKICSYIHVCPHVHALCMLCEWLYQKSINWLCISWSCIYMIFVVVVRFRPRSGGWRLCNAISVGSGLPVYTLQSSFPSSPSRCDTTDFLVFLVLSCLVPCLRSGFFGCFRAASYDQNSTVFFFALPGIVHVSPLLA